MPSEIVMKCSALLKRKKWNIAFAESVTAGRLASEFSMTKHSGIILRGGIVCYEVFVKEQLLHVPHNVIKECTAESAEVTQLLAQQSAKLFNAKVTVALTGLASSGGSETRQKPVGTIFFYIIMPSGTIIHRELFHGTPEQIILQAVDKTAQLITENIESL
ncbi:CinA family protein [Flavobacterium foetidum]|uniref:CinA family protein n=1 Tax=Flavobacterium foetidum TaxID=2026681 RepID=UPI0010753700|nr:CinA family protein [Flavobacterium foetidum]KAF2514882.1 CinA family protein [Flavobacterium foetidum]